MADCIDQNSLPGVKETCRDFAVLEDHSLAHSLQEQEIVSHLASNVFKNRLAQQDRRIARQLQDEEDVKARSRLQRLHRDIEQNDSEIAMEIQEQLVRQAQQLRRQEEKDEAMARWLQEKEMLEERKSRTKRGEAFEEDGLQEKARSPKSSPLSLRHRFKFSSKKQKQGAQFYVDTPVEKKEAPTRPPPPQWDSMKAQQRSLADSGSLTDQAAVGSGLAPSLTCMGWEQDAGGFGLQNTRSLLNPQHLGGELRSGDTSFSQKDLLTSSYPLKDTQPLSSPEGTGRNMHVPQGMGDLTHSVAQLKLQEQELPDSEVARRHQEEEMKQVRQMNKSAQVSQNKPTPDEVVWSRPTDKCNYERAQKPTPERPTRPPLPSLSSESPGSSFLYSRSGGIPHCSQSPPRPAAPPTGPHYMQ